MSFKFPPTANGLPAMPCLSAMQKCIRRGLEVEAMQFAVELGHTSKAYGTMVGNRLQVISHEDIDTAKQPEIVPFVQAACQQAKEFYDVDHLAKWRLPIGNAIRMMARAKKSREGDHFQASVGLAAILEGFVPQIPDWAFDMHTLEGAKRGRGLDHFRAEGVRLEPMPPKDRYEDEAYRLWGVKHAGKTKPRLEPKDHRRARPTSAVAAQRQTG